jgi:hypothetical protein
MAGPFVLAAALVLAMVVQARAFPESASSDLEPALVPPGA